VYNDAILLLEQLGTCDNGAVVALASRTQHHHCGSCDNGYYLSNKKCYAWEGSCSKGTLITQASRRTINHCGSCHDGYHLSNKKCTAYNDACDNGAVVALASRTQHHHCGTCDAGFYLETSTKTCAPCDEDAFKPGAYPAATECTPKRKVCAAKQFLQTRGSAAHNDACNWCPTAGEPQLLGFTRTEVWFETGAPHLASVRLFPAVSSFPLRRHNTGSCPTEVVAWVTYSVAVSVTNVPARR